MSDPEFDEDANYNEDDWGPGDLPCPDCGAPTELRGWWDDPPSYGGALIGTQYRCTKCEWALDQ